MIQAMPLCPWESPTLLFFSSNAYPLFYYAHFVPILVGAMLVGLLLWRNFNLLPVRMLFSLFAISAAWILIDMASTATNRPDLVVFLWSVLVLIEPLLYVAALFLFYAFAYDRIPPLNVQVVLTLLIAPLILLAPTMHNIPGISIEDCNASEGILASHYSYIVEVILTLWISVLALVSIAQSKDPQERRKLIFFSLGLAAFLISFASGNLIGSFTGDWESAQYGLFGLPVFIGFLGYIIVRFDAFRVKVVETQALVVALAMLVFSLLFVETLELVFIIASGTFVLVCALGWLLIRSVNREIQQRELIQKQEQELEVINEQQKGLLHFISHEIKGFLTKGQNAFAGIVEGDYGPVSPQVRDLSVGALEQMRKGVSTVMDILDASNLKKGTITFDKKAFDMRSAVERSANDMRIAAESKGLQFEVSIPDGEYVFVGDEAKLSRHVFRNLIDNSIKYTLAGSIRIALTKKEGGIQFTVSDTGVGISPEDRQRLFTEGGKGKDSIKVNVDSTGYGLFVAKQVVEAHGGTITVDSEGPGKGATFTVSFPA
jgi:signal transduction histidine kinase